MDNTPEEAKLIDSFKKAFPYKIMTAPPHGELRFTNQEIEDFLLSTHRTAREEGRREGRQGLINEVEHEQKKMLDGFGHPKDCKQCAALIDARTNK